MNLVKNKRGRGEEGQQAMNSEVVVPHSALSSELSRVSWNGTIDLSEKDQGSGVWFLLFGLSFTLECATAALTVGNQERLGL